MHGQGLVRLLELIGAGEKLHPADAGEVMEGWFVQRDGDGRVHLGQNCLTASDYEAVVEIIAEHFPWNAERVELSYFPETRDMMLSILMRGSEGATPAGVATQLGGMLPVDAWQTIALTRTWPVAEVQSCLRWAGNHASSVYLDRQDATGEFRALSARRLMPQ